MLDIAQELHRWVTQGRDVAVATVAAVSGSAPRPPGAALAVDTEGTVIGSVSGGCVEGAVYELCRQDLKDGETVLERFGYSDEDAFTAGLTCGGAIDVLVTPVRADDPARPVLVLALEGDGGQAAALKSCCVHQLVGQDTQVFVVCGRLLQTAGLLPAAVTGEFQGRGESAGGLAAPAQQYSELDGQAEEGGAHGGSVQNLPVEGLQAAV